LAVSVLTIQYFNGSTLTGLFEGIVSLSPTSTPQLIDPPWVTQPPCGTAPPDEDGLFGADLEDLAKRAKGNPHALSPRSLLIPRQQPVPPRLPQKVTLANLPPIGMQGTLSKLGSPGSCISWSFAYGLGSYTAARRIDG